MYMPLQYAVPGGVFIRVNRVCNGAPVFWNTQSIARVLAKWYGGTWVIGTYGAGSCPGNYFVTGGQGLSIPDGTWGGIQVNCIGMYLKITNFSRVSHGWEEY